MDVEGIIKRNSTLLEAMDNISVGMEAYVEVSRPISLDFISVLIET